MQKDNSVAFATLFFYFVILVVAAKLKRTVYTRKRTVSTNMCTVSTKKRTVYTKNHTVSTNVSIKTLFFHKKDDQISDHLFLHIIGFRSLWFC